MCNICLPQAQTKNFLQKFKRIKTCLLIWHRQDRAPGQVLPRKILGIKPGLSLKKYNIHTALVNQDTLHISIKCKLILVYLSFCYEKKKILWLFESQDQCWHYQINLNKFGQIWTIQDKCGQVLTGFPSLSVVNLIWKWCWNKLWFWFRHQAKRAGC